MELKNNFSSPTRQSYVAILLILYRVYTRFIKQFWYLLIPFFIGKKADSKILIYSLIGLSIVLAIYSIIDFLRYRFYFDGSDLIVEKGVFSRKRIVIPFDRIQSINFKQNIIHQVFSVVGLEIDTAGTSKKEFDFHALNKKVSRDLRDYIFANRKTLSSNKITNSDVSSSQPIQNVLKLEIGDLIKIGLTQNHLKSLVLAFFSLYWMLEQLRNIGINIDQYTKVTEENILKLSLYLLIGLVTFSIVFLIIVSVIRNVFRYYNLVLNRIPNGFKLEYGLLDRNEISVMDNKMQVIKWSDNLLRRALGLFTLRINLASSVAVKQRKAILIPGIKRGDINKIINFYFPKDITNSFKFDSADKYYLIRRSLIVTMIFALGYILLFWLIRNGEILSKDVITSISMLTILFLYFLFTSFLRYKKIKFGFNNEVLQINSGIFGNKFSLYTIYKLQGVSIKQSPVQVRKGLANLVIYSGAGTERIKYIKKQTAEKIRDFLLYRIETDKREWM